MRFPYKHTVFRQRRGDNHVVLAISKLPTITKSNVTTSTGKQVTHLSKVEVEQTVSQLFVLGADLITSAGLPENLPLPPRSIETAMELLSITAGEKGVGAITFLNALRLHLLGQIEAYNGALGWVKEMSLNMFAAFFLILRAARLRWHAKPSVPHENHPDLPKAIDSFNEVATGVEWGGMETAIWLRDGAMWLDPRTEEEKERGQGLDMDGGEDNTSKTMGVEEIAEMMKALSIDFDFDVASLETSLKKLDMDVIE
ncbi:hypothetical protein V8F06_011099 [Rhypophila decipiens]